MDDRGSKLDQALTARATADAAKRDEERRQEEQRQANRRENEELIREFLRRVDHRTAQVVAIVGYSYRSPRSGGYEVCKTRVVDQVLGWRLGNDVLTVDGHLLYSSHSNEIPIDDPDPPARYRVRTGEDAWGPVTESWVLRHNPSYLTERLAELLEKAR